MSTDSSDPFGATETDEVRKREPLQRIHRAAGAISLAPGTAIGRYVVERELGSGGMGMVVLARDPELDRKVAIKLLHANVAGTQVRLLREGQAIAKLRHPNVIAVYDVGTHDGAMFIAMELVEGGTLRRWLAEPRGWREVVAVFAQIGRGLAAAHAAGLVHRDVKPENVLLGSDGRVVVTDFGLARASDDAAPAPRDSQSALDLDLTKTGATLGTPAYMSPEQFESRAIDARSDQFSFCVALYEALHGARPFAGKTLEELRDAVLSHRITGPTRRGVPDGLQRAVLRGLSRDPDSRFRSMDELVATLASRRRRWPWLAAAGAAVTVAATVALGRHAGVVPCDEGSLLAGRWDPAARAALFAKLGRGSTPTEQAIVDKTFAAYDAHAGTILQLASDTCRARDKEEIGAREAAIVRSCLLRRAIELDVTRRQTLARPVSLHAAEQRAEWTLPPEQCRELDAPAMTVAPAVVTDLFERIYQLDATGTPDQYVERGAAIEKDADRAGELELATIGACLVATGYHRRSDSASAIREYERCYRRALAIHDGNRATISLLNRVYELTIMSDNVAARSLAQTAAEQAERVTISGKTRTRLYWMLGHTAKLTGDLPRAVATLREGIELIRRDGRDLQDLNQTMTYDLVDALTAMDGELDAAVAMARAALEPTREYYGTRSNDYVNMQNALAIALSSAGDAAGAVALRREVLATCQSIGTCNPRWLLDVGLGLGEDLCAAGEFREAAATLSPLREQIEREPNLSGARPIVYRALACAAYTAGDLDGAIRLYSRAIDENIAAFGKAHPSTLNLRRSLADAELERGNVAEADRQVVETEAAYREIGEQRATVLATLRGDLVARLALARGHPAAAEALAVDARSALSHLRGTEQVWLAPVLSTLGTSRVAQHRYDDAREPLERARELYVAHHGRDDYIALVDLQRALVEEALGHRDEASALARAVDTTLSKFPGQVRARRDVGQLLRRLGGPGHH